MSCDIMCYVNKIALRRGDRMKKFKWPAALLTFMVVLGLGVALVHLSRRQMVNEPLINSIGQLEFVEKVDLAGEKNNLTVTVALRYVDDYSRAYRYMKDVADNLLGAGTYRLEVTDNRNDALEEAYYAIHATLYEGEFRGNFTEMHREAARILESMEIEEYKIMVDSENIYLQLRDGEAYLYELIVRQNNGREGETG